MSRHLHQAYEILRKSNLDTLENRNDLFTQLDPLQTAFAFKILNEANLLCPLHRTAILSHPQPHRLAKGLTSLKLADLESLSTHLLGPYPEALANIFVDLSQSMLLSSSMMAKILEHPDQQNLAFAITNLKQFWILNAETLELIFHHSQPSALALGLSYLARVDLLTPKNQSLIVKSLHLEILTFLYASELLNQENLDLVFNPSYAFLLSPAAFDLLWHQWPNELIRTHWPRILATAHAPLPQAELQALTTRLLNPPEPEPSLNSSQSTHTASIHQSVRQSVLELKKIYSHDLKTIQAIQMNIQGLASNLKTAAALRFLERLSSSAMPELKELVCLVYTAIHDETRCLATFDDSLKCLVDGFYEIQRGYNLDEEGNDRGGEDKPICMAGSIHKMIEKLSGIHPAVELKFVTHEIAHLKFPIMVNQAICHYLQTLASPKNLQELARWTDLVSKLKHHGIESIWPDIKDSLITRFFEEFASLYQGHDFEKFEALLANVKYLNIPDLSQFQAQVGQSQAYRDYLKGLALCNHFIWQNNQKSEEMFKSSRVACKTMLE